MSAARDEMILHSRNDCPFSISVRIVLALKHIPYKIHDEGAAEFSAELKELLEEPSVPALRHNGRVIVHFGRINEYLENYCPDPELMPFSRGSSKEVQFWYDWCERQLKPQVDTYLSDASPDERFKAKSEIERYFEHLQFSLQGKPFLLGGALTLADISVIPFVYIISLSRRDAVNFRHFPKVKVWADQIIGKPFFETEVMKSDRKIRFSRREK